MSTDTIKKTHKDELLRIYSIKYSQNIGKLGSGVAAFSVPHNLGFIPAFKVFYQSSTRSNKRWFTFPNTFEGSVTDTASMAYYDPFLISFSVDNNNFNFNCVNEDSVDHTLVLVFLIYADKGAGQR
jgi:hypothetical protein